MAKAPIIDTSHINSRLIQIASGRMSKSLSEHCVKAADPAAATLPQQAAPRPRSVATFADGPPWYSCIAEIHEAVDAKPPLGFYGDHHEPLEIRRR